VARPSPAERRARDERRAANAAKRAEAAQQNERIAQRVEAIVSDALRRPTRRDGLPDLPELIAKCDAAYELSMVARLPGYAIRAVELQAQLLGMLVDRQAIVHGRVEGNVLHGSVEDNRRQVLERMRERYGSAKTQRLLEVLEDKSTIEGEAIEDDGDE
jgi:hypothetical protein